MPSRTAQKRRRATAAAAATDPADPVARAMRSRGPRCQCEHGTGRCRRRATHRVSVICAEPGCSNAVHTYLRCPPCLEDWVTHAASCRHCPELRVSPL